MARSPTSSINAPTVRVIQEEFHAALPPELDGCFFGNTVCASSMCPSLHLCLYLTVCPYLLSCTSASFSLSTTGKPLWRCGVFSSTSSRRSTLSTVFRQITGVFITCLGPGHQGDHVLTAYYEIWS